jgi:hypothetical protein
MPATAIEQELLKGIEEKHCGKGSENWPGGTEKITQDSIPRNS